MSGSILDRVAEGEQNAVAECIERYSGLVWSIARRLSSTAAEAEDAVQEVFIDIWKSASRFDPAKGSEKVFVTMVARRRLIDRMRRSGRRPETQPFSLDLPPVDSQSASRLEDQADAALAIRALSELKPERRKVLLMSVLYGMSHSEISKAVHLPVGTVKSHILRGLRMVRERLAPARSVSGR